MRGEREQILKMLEEGKITAEEAMKLLDTLEPAAHAAPNRRSKFIRVNITSSDGEKVIVNLPISLARMALRVAGNFEPKVKELDLDAIIEEVEAGAGGRLVEINDGDSKVEVYVD